MKQSKLRLILLFLLVGVLARIYWQMLRDPYFLPPVLTIGPLSFHWYGISIVSGMAVAVYLFNKLWKRFADKDIQKKLKLQQLFIILIITGVIGARIYHLITDWQLYEGNLLAAFAIWNGGLGIYGGVFAGLLALYLYCKEKELPFLLLADLAAVVLPLAQTIGRFGNLFNRELAGTGTDLPWAVILPIPGPLNNFHPTFLYEQIGDLALYGLLWYLVAGQRLKPGTGKPLLIYVAGYALVRFVVDFFRLEPRVFFGIFTTAQTVSLLLFVTVLGYWIYRNRKIS